MTEQKTQPRAESLFMEAMASPGIYELSYQQAEWLHTYAARQEQTYAPETKEEEKTMLVYPAVARASLHVAAVAYTEYTVFQKIEAPEQHIRNLGASYNVGRALAKRLRTSAESFGKLTIPISVSRILQMAAGDVTVAREYRVVPHESGLISTGQSLFAVIQTAVVQREGDRVLYTPYGYQPQLIAMPFSMNRFPQEFDMLGRLTAYTAIRARRMHQWAMYGQILDQLNHYEKHTKRYDAFIENDDTAILHCIADIHALQGAMREELIKAPWISSFRAPGSLWGGEHEGYAFANQAVRLILGE